MTPAEELRALRRLAELEDKAAAAHEMRVAAQRDADRKLYDPTNDMNAWERGLAGAGKSLADLGRTAKRVGNMVGIGDYDQKAAQEDADLDKALMDTTGGKVGKFVGDVALTLAPGLGVANRATQGTRAVAAGLKNAGPAGRGAGVLMHTLAPYWGGAYAGALTGAALSPEDLSGGARTGAMFGAGGELAGRVLSAAGGGAKAVFEPLYREGQERILKRTLERFAKDPDSIARAAKNPEIFVEGAAPTLAQATGDVGLAQLERGASTMPEVMNALEGARHARVSAYRNKLDDLAGNSGARDMAEAAREATAQELYGKAWAKPLELSDEVLAQSRGLMQRPPVVEAMANARKVAQARGDDIAGDLGGSVQGLHRVKKSLDAQIAAAKQAGDTDLAAAIKSTQDELVGMLQKASPEYAEAMAEYAAMSRPVNQMAVGKVLRDTLTPPAADFNENVMTTMGDAYMRKLRDPNDLARTATGLKGAKYENVMDPAQIETVEGIAKDLARAKATETMGKLPGSPTAQFMGARNILQQALGPLGFPQSITDHVMGDVAASVLSLPFRMSSQETEKMLARAVTDPRFAAAVMQVKDNPGLLRGLVQQYSSQAAIQAGTQ